jgi:hypothetical protein
VQPDDGEGDQLDIAEWGLPRWVTVERIVYQY